MVALRQNVANGHDALTVLTLRWRISPQDVRMADEDTTQDNFILPAPPVTGLSIRQDQLEIM